MRILIYSRPRKHHLHFSNLLLSGFRKHGQAADLVIAEDSGRVEYQACDLAVVWGYRYFENLLRTHTADFLMAEMGFIGDREQWHSLGFNGLNGRADFQNQNSPSDRWEKYFSNRLQPWKNGDAHILVAGQVVGDSSLREYGRVDYNAIVSEISRQTDLPVYFRRHPHPRRMVYSCPTGAIETTGTLEENLRDCACLVAINSNTCVDAILSGVPCIALDRGAMTYPLNSSWRTIPEFNKPDRTQWAYDMAYTQWTDGEIESGEAWEHLKKRYA